MILIATYHCAPVKAPGHDLECSFAEFHLLTDGSLVGTYAHELF